MQIVCFRLFSALTARKRRLRQASTVAGGYAARSPDRSAVGRRRRALTCPSASRGEADGALRAPPALRLAHSARRSRPARFGAQGGHAARQSAPRAPAASGSRAAAGARCPRRRTAARQARGESKGTAAKAAVPRLCNEAEKTQIQNLCLTYPQVKANSSARAPSPRARSLPSAARTRRQSAPEARARRDTARDSPCTARTCAQSL